MWHCSNCRALCVVDSRFATREEDKEHLKPCSTCGNSSFAYEPLVINTSHCPNFESESYSAVLSYAYGRESLRIMAVETGIYAAIVAIIMYLDWTYGVRSGAAIAAKILFATAFIISWILIRQRMRRYLDQFTLISQLDKSSLLGGDLRSLGWIFTGLALTSVALSLIGAVISTIIFTLVMLLFFVNLVQCWRDKVPPGLREEVISAKAVMHRYTIALNRYWFSLEGEARGLVIKGLPEIKMSLLELQNRIYHKITRIDYALDRIRRFGPTEQQDLSDLPYSAVVAVNDDAHDALLSKFGRDVELIKLIEKRILADT